MPRRNGFFFDFSVGEVLWWTLPPGVVCTIKHPVSFDHLDQLPWLCWVDWLSPRLDMCDHPVFCIIISLIVHPRGLAKFSRERHTSVEPSKQS